MSVNRLDRISARHWRGGETEWENERRKWSKRPKNRWSRCGQEYDIGVRGDVVRGHVDRRFRISVVDIQAVGSWSRGEEEEKEKMKTALYFCLYTF